MGLGNFRMNVSRWMKNKIKQCDVFSQPVELSYKGQTKYSTFIGGCASLIIIIVMVIYATSLLIALVYRSETRKSKNTIVQDLSDSPPVYNVDKNNFGIFHLYRNSFSDPVYDESYFNVRYYQVITTVNDEGMIVDEITEYGHEHCNENFPFSNLDYITRTGLINHIH